MYWLLSLQDIRLLNAGKPAQHTAEVERELDNAETQVRLLFNDVQVLKDERHPQAEQMYRRWVQSVLHSTYFLYYKIGYIQIRGSPVRSQPSQHVKVSLCKILYQKVKDIK